MTTLVNHSQDVLQDNMTVSVIAYAALSLNSFSMQENKATVVSLVEPTYICLLLCVIWACLTRSVFEHIYKTVGPTLNEMFDLYMACK